MMSCEPTLRLVVAVHSEARPLTDRLHLQRASQESFPIYDGNDVCLIVSGVGKSAAAAATAYLEARRPSPLSTWLNVGIAGHRSEPTGTLFLAHRIRDASAGRSFFPSLVAAPGRATASVVTVDRPERGFPDDSLYEMEAAGFYETALRFTESELIQAVKIVSDNLESPAETLTKERVSSLVFDQVEPVLEVAEGLKELARNAQAQAHRAPRLSDFQELWHFSETQSLRLAHLLKRGELLLDKELAPDQFSDYKNSREVLEALEEILDRIQLRPEAPPESSGE